MAAPGTLLPVKTYLLENATIVDPIQGTATPGQNIVLRDGRILCIAPVGADKPIRCHDERSVSPPYESNIAADDYVRTIEIPTRAPSSDVVVLRIHEISKVGDPITHSIRSVPIDCTGKYVLPGLIDSHVHLSAVPGSASLAEMFTLPSTVIALRQPATVLAMLRRGFTTVRDCGGATLALKASLEQHVFPGPRVRLAGAALTQTGGHADRRGALDATPKTACCGGMGGRICDGVPEATAAAREELRAGADFLKIMAGGGVSSPTDAVEHVQFSPDEMAAIVRVAKQRGTYVTAHAYTPAAIAQAVDAGVRAIEHGNLMDRATARQLAHRGVFLTPTLVTYAALGAPEFRGYLPPAGQEKNQRVLAAGLQSVRLAKEEGVAMCYGTDLLGPMGVRQSGGVGLMAQVLEPAEVIRTMTVNPARMLGEEGQLGVVQEGALADLGIWNANPLDDVSVLERPEECLLAVLVGGRCMVSRWSKMEEDLYAPLGAIE